jgi:hypothetical protein
MDSLEAMKSEKIHLTLTLGEVDVLHKAGVMMHERMTAGTITERDLDAARDLQAALQKLDEEVNSK